VLSLRIPCDEELRMTHRPDRDNIIPRLHAYVFTVTQSLLRLLTQESFPVIVPLVTIVLQYPCLVANGNTLFPFPQVNSEVRSSHKNVR
jgi:hypothetical protein